MRTVVVLQQVQLAVFVLTALLALRTWARHRSRPAGFLALAFGVLGVTILASRLLPPEGGWAVALGRDLVLAGLAAFPWLLALFAWSFEGRTPRWLRAAGVLVVGLAAWSLAIPPLPASGEPRPAWATMFVLVFVLIWAALAAVSAVQLWRAGGQQPLVRARTRTMAVGAVMLAAALLLVGNATGPADSPLRLVAQALAIGSALLFVTGFAPPQVVRLWWRRRATRDWSAMQLELIAAETPDRIASAVIPTVAEVLGVGAAVLGPTGAVLASSRFDDIDEVAARLVAEDAVPDDVEVRQVADHLLVLRTTPYTPLFGQDERSMVEGFTVQLQLALERAQLFEANLRTTEELRRANDEQQAMVTGLAHDLRSPAITIGGFTDLLRDTDDEAERARMLDAVESSTRYLDQLVQALVDLARVGQRSITRVEVDLDRLIDEVEARLAVSHPQVRVLRPTPLPRIEGEPLGIAQVFDNLLSNAARHGGRDELTITVTGTTDRDGRVHLEVEDDGVGVHPDDRDTIFVPFRRGRRAASGGSGVGLGMVRRVIEAHDGTIELAETEVGARFLIDLPPGVRHAVARRAGPPAPQRA